MTPTLIGDLRVGDHIQIGPGPYLTATVAHIDVDTGMVRAQRPYCHLSKIGDTIAIAYTGIEQMTWYASPNHDDRVVVNERRASLPGDITINSLRAQAQKAGL